VIDHSLKDWLSAGIVTAAGGGCLGHSLWSAAEGLASAGWPIAEGEITAATVDVTPSRIGHYYEPCVTYTYRVAGTVYRGTRLRFGDTSYNFKSSAIARIAPYAVGTSVHVRYHPDKPGRSVLQPGLELRTYVISTWFLVVFAFGVWLLTDLVR